MKYSPSQLRDFSALVLVDLIVELVNKELDMDREFWDRAMEDLAMWNCKFLFQ